MYEIGFYMGLKEYAKLSGRCYMSLISNHLQNRRVDEARKIFDSVHKPGVGLFTMMVTGYARNHRLEEAFEMFDKIPMRDTVSWNAMIKGSLDCGNLKLAEKVFDEMPHRSIVSWTTMIHGFMRFGEVEKAEILFQKMPVKDVASYNSMIHGYFSNRIVEGAVDLFEEMRSRDVISWTSMISGLGQNGRNKEALLLFKRMMRYGFKPSSPTLVCAVTASANLPDLRLGIEIHGQIIKLGYSFDEFISASLITFYSNCKLVGNASEVLKEKLHNNVAVWTALITGYTLNSEPENALKVFMDMVAFGIIPNQSSFTSALNACCALEDVDRGKIVHSRAIKLGLETDAFVGNSLIVMYSKCGNINDGILVFKRIDEKNIVSWNSVIMGCAQHGLGLLALTLFGSMTRSGIKPDDITLTGLLSACNHSGMLRKGLGLFEHFGRAESFEHHACMVDLLGRCGKLEEAEGLIKLMPFLATNSKVWLSLLGSCRMYSNLEVAKRAAQKIFKLEPSCSAAYVLLSNTYTSAKKWSEVSKIRAMMRRKGITKQPGSSWVIVKGIKHEFLAGDRSHPLSKKIYRKLDWLGAKLKESGYVPDQNFALHDVETEQKEEILSQHSERIAIAFALISTVEGSSITVMKNLRVCGDCHSAIKLIAKIARREIVLRDSSRFHHFRDGICSCGDYW